MKIIVDAAERIFLVLLGVNFWINIYPVILERPYILALAISETLSVIFILIRKPGEVATRAYPLFVALMGTGLPLLIRGGGDMIAPKLLIEVLLFGGVAITIAAKLYLNKSFGLIAANRGIKIAGPYRLVRHPMYLGYFLNQLGFLLSAFSAYVMTLYLFAWLFQILRIIEEEKILMKDSEYADFAARTRWRVIPGVF